VLGDLAHIKNKRQWYDWLKAARAQTQEVSDSITSWTLISVIVGRLDAMEAAIANGRMPTQREREKALALGVLAVRSLDLAVPAYSHLLKELAAGFESWAELPDDDDDDASGG
jgi:hypothetical protein